MNGVVEVYINHQGNSATRCGCRSSTRRQTSWRYLRQNWSTNTDNNQLTGQNHRQPGPGLRRTNAERSLLNKKRVIKMLFAVVLEFFICWTPLYTINTLALFDPSIIYDNLGYTAISFFQLLAYSSSCCNPITYCFMNCGFRKSFVNLFRCFRKFKNDRGFGMNGSDIHMESKWVNRGSENA